MRVLREGGNLTIWKLVCIHIGIRVIGVPVCARVLREGAILIYGSRKLVCILLHGCDNMSIKTPNHN